MLIFSAKSPVFAYLDSIETLLLKVSAEILMSCLIMPQINIVSLTLTPFSKFKLQTFMN